jgi:hypothetical protein
MDNQVQASLLNEALEDGARISVRLTIGDHGMQGNDDECLGERQKTLMVTSFQR